EAGTRRLVDLLQTADPDPWRQRMRSALSDKNWAVLEFLAKSQDLEEQPAATLTFLCAALRAQAEADDERSGGEESALGQRWFFREIDVLRRAQSISPADYWINHRLGISLIWLNSPDIVQEGIGYMRAAVALRPNSSHAFMDLGRGYLL